MLSKKDLSLRLSGDQIPANYNYVPGLNGLRAASILMVLIGHFMVPPQYRGLGSVGVSLFFGISGFLITRLLFAEHKVSGKVHVGAFFIRRIFRLYPVISVYLIFICIMTVALGQKIHWLEVTSVVLYFTNYLETYRMLSGQGLQMAVGQFWSLAVEEHFYLIMPFVFIRAKARPQRVLYSSAILIIVPLIIRILYVTIYPEIIGHEIVYRPSETRFDGIAMGVFVAALCETERGRKIVRALASPYGFMSGCGLLLFTLAVKGSIFGDTLRYSLRSLSCVVIVIGVVFGEKLTLVQRLMNNSAASWFGVLSYSLYVWQGSSRQIVGAIYDPTVVASGALCVACSFLLAIPSYYIVERPALKLRRFLEDPGMSQKKRLAVGNA